MSKLLNCLNKITSMTKADKALLVQDAEALEAKGVSPNIAAKRATKNAAEEIDSIFENLRSATARQLPELPELLDMLESYYNGHPATLRELPRPHEAVARKLAEAGKRTPEEIHSALGEDGAAWVGTFSQWIDKNMPTT
jgi:hypothetical protein